MPKLEQDSYNLGSGLEYSMWTQHKIASRALAFSQEVSLRFFIHLDILNIPKCLVMCCIGEIRNA